MATKTQAKNLIDAAVVLAKNEIDNILPTGVNIVDGHISFGPTKVFLKMDAGGNSTTALAWANTITANLDAASRPYTVKGSRGRREEDAPSHEIVINSILSQLTIVNF